MQQKVGVRVALSKDKVDKARDIHDYYGVPLSKLLFADVLSAFERLHNDIPKATLERIRKEREPKNR